MRTGLSKPGLVKGKVRQAFADPDMYATSLFVLFVDYFGEEVDEYEHMECLNWAPATIALEIRDEFNLEIPAENFHKLMAAIAIKTSDDFFTRPRRFIELCNILAGDDFDPTIFNPATVPEMAWGMTEALLLEPPEAGEEFNPVIRGYIGFMLEQASIVNPPDILAIALHRDDYNDPLSSFSDDPEMYSAISETLTDKTTELTDLIKDNLQELIAQLANLPLSRGNAEEFVNRAQHFFRSFT
jgi:hypothetical protein